MKKPPEPFIHVCQAPGCQAWGAYGFGVSLLRGQRGRWYCRAHRANGEWAPPAAAPVEVNERQGILL